MNFEQLIQRNTGKKGTINDYLHVKGGFLFYKNIKLMSLVEQYGTPLEVAYTDMINKKVRSLKNIFKKAIRSNKYPSKYLYAYATKANYYSEAVLTALNNADCLETSSSYDLDIIENLFNKKLINKKLMIICNGFKHGRYFGKIIALRKKGLNLFPIIENSKEAELFLNKTKLKFNLGMRLNIDRDIVKTFEGGKRLGSNIESRFGLSFQEMVECAEKIGKSKHLSFKIFHFHLGGTINNIGKFTEFVGDIFENRFCVLKKNHPNLDFFDFGGGLPVQYNLKFKFDYELFADKLVKKIIKVSNKNSITPPILIGEHGRYTVNDHGFSLFKIEVIKKTNKPNTLWYLINSSLMNFLPDSWALGQDFVILPLNGWKEPHCKVKLGGMTCDPDDTYYKSEKDNFIYLPKMPEEKNLYIGIFGTGSYQEMISGVGGVHHCLLPEGIELIIYKKKGKFYFDKISRLQTPQKVLKILGYHRHRNLKRYKN